MQEILDQDLPAVGIHVWVERREPARELGIHLIPGQAHHAPNNRIRRERDRNEIEGNAGKHLLFFADHRKKLRESIEELPPVLTLCGEKHIRSSLLRGVE